MASLNLEATDVENYYKQVFEEYGKTKEDLEEYVNILNEWCKKQLHWPEMPLACKFSTEKAKNKIDMYYTIRRIMPELYTEHPLSDRIRFHSKVVYLFPLPKLTNKNHIIIYTQFNNINKEYGLEHFKVELFLSQLFQILEVLLQREANFNFEVIFNSIDTTLAHMLKITPMSVKKLITCLEKVYCNRLAKIYLVNVYSFVENLVNSVVKPLLPEKLRKRIQFVENHAELIKIFGKTALPKEIGGEEYSLDEQNEAMFKKFEEMKTRFDKIQFMTVDESKRAAKLENDDLLGYYGSFKQINVD